MGGFLAANVHPEQFMAAGLGGAVSRLEREAGLTASPSKVKV